jgi:hypothetical protein
VFECWFHAWLEHFVPGSCDDKKAPITVSPRCLAGVAGVLGLLLSRACVLPRSRSAIASFPSEQSEIACIVTTISDLFHDVSRFVSGLCCDVDAKDYRKLIMYTLPL